MTGWIGVLERVVVNVGIAVQRLRVPGVRHDRVGLDEPAQFGIVIAGVVIAQAGLLIEYLSGITVGD